jgi:hypothetical protein
MKTQVDLNSIPEFIELSDKRKTLVRAVVAGASLANACRTLGMNVSRERVRKDIATIMFVLQTGLRPTGDSVLPLEDSANDVYAQADALRRQYEAMSEEEKREYCSEQAARAPKVCKCGAPLVPSTSVAAWVPDYEMYIHQNCSRCQHSPDFCDCDKIDWTRCHGCKTPAPPAELKKLGILVLCPECDRHWANTGRLPTVTAPTPTAQAAPIDPTAEKYCTKCGQPAQKRDTVCLSCYGALKVTALQ